MNRLPALPPKLVADPKADDGAQPAPQLCRLAQFRKVFPSGHERFLGEIFALADTARGAIGERADEGLIPLDDLAEGIRFPRETFGHQFRIVL